MHQIATSYNDVPYKSIIRLLYGTEKSKPSERINKILVDHDINHEMSAEDNAVQFDQEDTGEDDEFEYLGFDYN